MKYVLLLLALTGCVSQSPYKTMTYTHSNGRVETISYKEVGTPGYISNSSSAAYTDGYGRAIGYGYFSEGIK